MNSLPVKSSWDEFLLSHATDDLLMVARNQRLRYGSAPIGLHWLDRVSLLLVRQAFIRRQSLALCYPVPACNLAMLVAAQLLIHDFVKNWPGSLSLLLVSSRTEVREHYLNLRIERQPLALALPLARIRADGEPAVIPVRGGSSAQRPRLYHLSRPFLLDAPWPKRIRAVIVDHAVGTFDDHITRIRHLAARRGIRSVIHLCTDPFAPFLEELRASGVPIWIWDHYGLATDFADQIATGDGSSGHPLGVSAGQFENIAAGIGHHVLVCRHPILEAAARRLWGNLGTVQRTFGDAPGFGIPRAIRAAYGTYYTMLQMLVPLPIYEEEARNLWGIRPVSRRIADLEAFAPLLRDEAPDLAEVYWPSLIQDLKEMQAALEVGNPKYDALVEQIHESQKQEKGLVIVCPNRATKRMLQLCLRAREGLRLSEVTEREDDQTVRLVTYKELRTLASCDMLLLPGQFSLGRRQYALTAAAPGIFYLAYGDEADRIERQVAGIHHTLAGMAGPKERQQAWAALTAFTSRAQLPEAGSEAIMPAIKFVRIEGKKVSRRAVTADRVADLSLWTPFATSEYDLVGGQDTLSSDREEALCSPDVAFPSRQNALVPALRIEFVDGFCYAEPGSRMTVLLPATGKSDDRIVDGLRSEDIVIFVDGDQRRQLYEAVLERIEHHPAMGVTYILVRYWQQAVREGFLRSGMTYGDFLQALQRLGSHMETIPGVRCWVTGQVLGPRDPKDIWRVGKVLTDEVLVQEWKEIRKALRRVRGLHVSLARKLNRIIVEAGLRGRHPDAAEECLDQELNLYLDDFRDSVTVHRITAISREKTQVPYVLTGRFFEKGVELTW